MNRTQKIALLTKVIQGDAPASRLQQVIDTAPRSLVIIDDLGCRNAEPMIDSDAVSFHDRGKQHHMSWGEAQQYIESHRIGTLFILPAKC